MPQITLATFNCENLMMRCDFSGHPISNLARKLTAVSDPGQAEEVDRAFNVLSEDDRTLTAQALAATGADVCCLQEVENLVALTAFHNRYLRRWSRRGYPYRALIEGNDTRGIDVAVLSRAKLTRRVSHAALSFTDLEMTPPKSVPTDARVFRRDCLEVDVEKQGRRLTLFVCHFKSMNGGRA
ncbi:MAG: endonuclease/exonuclease/phosphatase family protein, partial [Pseudomonadota bacterium]